MKIICQFIKKGETGENWYYLPLNIYAIKVLLFYFKFSLLDEVNSFTWWFKKITYNQKIWKQSQIPKNMKKIKQNFFINKFLAVYFVYNKLKLYDSM